VSAALAFAAAAGVIGLLAANRKRDPPQSASDDGAYQSATAPGDVVVPGAGDRPTDFADGAGGVTVAAPAEGGLVLVSSPSSPTSTSAPSTILDGRAIAPTATACAPNAGGGMDCVDPRAGAAAGKQMYQAVTGGLVGADPTTVSRTLLAIGPSLGGMW
jgi:hypothetical protein